VLSPKTAAGGRAWARANNRDSHCGTGAIRYPAVSGQVIADMLIPEIRKPANGGQIFRLSDIRNNHSLKERASAGTLAPENRARLEACPRSHAIQSHYALAQLQAYQGNMDKR